MFDNGSGRKPQECNSQASLEYNLEGRVLSHSLCVGMPNPPRRKMLTLKLGATIYLTSETLKTPIHSVALVPLLCQESQPN